MEDLTSAQHAIAGRIQDAYRNFGKDSAGRKTKNYLEQRMADLNDNWAEFEKNNKLINTIAEENQDHPYLVKTFFQNIKRLVEKFREEMQGLIESQPETATADNIANPPQKEAAREDAQHDEKEPPRSNYDFTVNTELIENADSGNAAERTSPDQLRRFRRQDARIDAILRARVLMDDSTCSKTFLAIKVKTLNDHWNAFIKEHEEIVSYATTIDYHYDYFVKNLFNVLEEDYMEIICNLQDRINKDTLKPAEEPTARSPLVKLPTMNITKFHGEYITWPSFKDMFISLIGSNKALSNIQKLHYLKINLGGEAEQLLRQIEVTNANYEMAWDILLKRYENKRVIIQTHLSRLYKLPMVKADSSSAIKTILDVTTETMQALSNIGRPTNNWDDWIVFLLVQKLDIESHKLWEQALSSETQPPTWTKLQEFLNMRFRALEATISKTRGVHSSSGDGGKTTGKSVSLLTDSSASTKSSPNKKDKSCTACSGNHPLYRCKKYFAMDIQARWNHVNNNKICSKCLNRDHVLANCTSSFSCKKCEKPHNNSLHENVSSLAVATTIAESSDTAINLAAITNAKCVLLATAVIWVRDINGDNIECRAILDSGSQLNFITEACQQKLGFPTTRKAQGICGIGDSKLKADRRMNICIQSKSTGFSSNMEVYVLKHIASDQPSRDLNILGWPIPKNIGLADPTFNKPGRIDMLIGAELYCNLMSIGQIQMGKELPTLQNTVFGWIIIGRVSSSLMDDPICGVTTQGDEAELQNQLAKFWEIENPERPNKAMTALEARCEEHFLATYKRDDVGRFILKLPFITDASELGQSREIATMRFFSLERKLNKNPELKLQYSNFLKEYLQLNHMERIEPAELAATHYFLPHHCVSKAESSTTKLRVVFDASAKTSNGTSLNDILANGPTIQDDLFSLLVRFRLYQYVFTSDIAKMYRQINIDESDRNMQLIIWRENPNEPLQYYRLRTLTYGTRPASFMATKCLQILAEENIGVYPRAAIATTRDFYVDDIMTGSNNLAEAERLQFELQLMLNSGGFKLRKWCSNHPALLQNIPQNEREHKLELTDGQPEQIKALGVTWLPHSDEFIINTHWDEGKRVTKRSVLADTAHLFDPLGLVNPVIVLAKMFMQELWLLKLDWDAALPLEMHQRWIKFRTELSLLNSMRLPRHITVPGSVDTELHAFADASEKAYGAAIYARSIDTHGVAVVRLVCAKSRVAPLKAETLPRLELNAAVLAVELINRVTTATGLKHESVVFWTDSEIVIAWINQESSSMKTFIRNRVASIQRHSKPEQWQHVPTKQNPADLVSRGMNPKQLLESKLWQNGPEFLHRDKIHWPNKETVAISLNTVLNAAILHTIRHRNSFKFLRGVAGYILRFINRCKKTRENSKFLRPEELKIAEAVLIREVQAECFAEDLKELRKTETVKGSSILKALAPLVCQEGLIRVGGRIEAAKLPYGTKHPVLLPNDHIFTKLLLEHLHRKNLHAGPQALTAIVRQEYWPLQIKKATRRTYHNCIICTKAKPLLMKQIMGDLPATRVQPAYPFFHTGVDFCGPVMVHYKIRGKQPTKAYIAVFVCFASKGVHLELVSDLTTAAFIGCLKRFISRKNKPAKIYCDNATNFVGAKNELNELQFLLTEPSQEAINKQCSNEGIEWSFIPPRSPHFGGLWEAAVKSAKTHLKKILHNQKLTYDELATVIAEIEAVLNSRPLTDPSSNPNDLEPITPAHLMYGRPISAITDHDSRRRNTVSEGWHIIKELKNEFWKRWSTEYLLSLQPRNKWRTQIENLDPGTLVIVRDNNLPPLKWKMARVVNTHPGKDGRARLVEIRTAKGISTAVIHNLCPLPVDTNTDNKASALEIDSIDTEVNEMAAFSGYLSIRNERKRRRDTKIYPAKRHSTTNYSVKDKSAFTGGASASKFMLLMCTFLAVTSAAPIQINSSNPVSEPLNNYIINELNMPSGIYFEEIGRANLITTEWNLIIFFDLQTYWLEFNELKEYIVEMKTLCQQGMLKTKGYCNATMEQLVNQLASINQKNQLLKTNEEIRGPRQRRSPFDIVGNVAHSLFGILDSKFAEQYEDHIKGVRKNENYLLNLLQNHSSILEATANIIKKDEEDVLLQFHEFKNDLKQIASNSDHRQMFTTLALHTALALSNYQRTQDTLLSLIIDSQHGLIAPELLTPAQLQEQLNLIRRTIPKQLSVPKIEDSDNLLQTFKLLTINGRVTKRNVLISVKIPLISNEDFQLFNIVPVPVLHEGHLVSIKPHTKKMIVNLQRSSYYPMTEAELRLCKQMKNGRYLCYQHHPLYTGKATQSQCEFTLLTHIDVIPETCLLETGVKANTWTQLYSPNTWIFSNFNEETVDIICGEHLSPLKINGTGLLQLGANCMIKHPAMIIKRYDWFHNEMNSAIVPTLDLSVNLKQNKIQINENTTKYGAVNTLLNRIQEQKSREVELPYHINIHDVHQYALLYTLIAALIIAAIFLYIRRCRNQERLIVHSTTQDIAHPKPAPRFQPKLDFNLEELQTNN